MSSTLLEPTSITSPLPQIYAQAARVVILPTTSASNEGVFDYPPSDCPSVDDLCAQLEIQPPQSSSQSGIFIKQEPLSPVTEYSGSPGMFHLDLSQPEAFTPGASCSDPSPSESGAGTYFRGHYGEACAETSTGRPAGDDTSWEVYHDLIMRCILQDMQATCAKLRLPQDPLMWSPSDVQMWVCETVRAQGLPEVDIKLFALPGLTLAQMHIEDFQKLAPQCAEKLKGCLEIWLAADEYSRNSLKVSSGGVLGLGSPSSSDCDPSPSLSYPVPYYSFPPTTAFDTNPSFSLTLPMESPSTPDSGIVTDEDFSLSAGFSPQGNGSGPSFNQQTQHVHLWQFIRQLLECPDKYSNCVRWVSRQLGIFKIENSSQLARYWGQRKNRPAMNYDKLSRSLRQYYKKGILQKTPRCQRLVYQFCHPYHL